MHLRLTILDPCNGLLWTTFRCYGVLHIEDVVLQTDDILELPEILFSFLLLLLSFYLLSWFREGGLLFLVWVFF